MRRAISCAYCAPRSTTRTGRRPSGLTRTLGPDRAPRRTVRRSVAHPHALRALVALALGPDRRRDDEFGLLELLDVRIARRRHRRRERTEQVERAVVLVGGTDEDLAKRRHLARPHARAAGKRRVERCHP